MKHFVAKWQLVVNQIVMESGLKPDMGNQACSTLQYGTFAKENLQVAPILRHDSSCESLCFDSDSRYLEEGSFGR